MIRFRAYQAKTSYQPLGNVMMINSLQIVLKPFIIKQICHRYRLKESFSLFKILPTKARRNYMKQVKQYFSKVFKSKQKFSLLMNCKSISLSTTWSLNIVSLLVMKQLNCFIIIKSNLHSCQRFRKLIPSLDILVRRKDK